MNAKRAFTILIALGAFGAGALGVRGALRSPVFWVRAVEVRGLPAGAPVGSEALVKLAGIPLGRVSLFSVRLEDVARRVQAHPWVRDARVETRLPHTLALEVELRRPVALLVTAQGALKYLDAQGAAFSDLDLRQGRDLPLVSGAEADWNSGGAGRVLASLALIRRWEALAGAGEARLSTLHWDRARGLLLTVAYPLERQGGWSRATVELGEWSEPEGGPQLGMLREVINYLSRNSIRARQISADSGKKVVVSVSHGS